MLLDTIKDYVLAECRQPQNVFGEAFFEEHILLVRDYARRLAEVLSADPEIVTLAAFLHDIAAVQDFAAVPQHHLLGAEAARELLLRQNYPPERAERVAACIRAHNSPLAEGAGSPEEVCLSNADAMAQIARPVYWLFYAFRIRKNDFSAGRVWLREWYEKKWGLLIPPAQELIAEEYRLACALLYSPEAR
jgi:uncharacterized protein